MQKKKPLVLKTDRVKVLTSNDLRKVEGGGLFDIATIPPKIETGPAH